MTVWSALVVPLPLLALSVVVDGPAVVAHALTHLTVPAVLSTLYTAWLASLVGYGIWNTLLARHAAAAVVPYTMLVPVVGLTTAWLVQGEAPNAWEACGGIAAPARGGRHDRGAGPPSASAPSRSSCRRRRRRPVGRLAERRHPPDDPRQVLAHGGHLLLQLGHGRHALGERRPQRPAVGGHRGVLVARAQLAGQPLGLEHERAVGRPGVGVVERGAPHLLTHLVEHLEGAVDVPLHRPAGLVGPHPEVRDRLAHLVEHPGVGAQPVGGRRRVPVGVVRGIHEGPRDAGHLPLGPAHRLDGLHVAVPVDPRRAQPVAPVEAGALAPGLHGLQHLGHPVAQVGRVVVPAPGAVGVPALAAARRRCRRAGPARARSGRAGRRAAPRGASGPGRRR